MENTNNNRLLCEQQNAQVIEWDKVPDFAEKKGQFETSLTHLGGLEGNSDEDVVYGAEYMETDIKTPYYERMVTTTVDIPWIAQDMEATYMNRTKPLNEKEPDLNFNIKLIPKNKYDEVYDIEGFGKSDTQNLFFKILSALFIIFIIYLLVKELK
ncbi:hypothetical protein QKU48_gp0156 [Fadolivirus algeromassiliense]|jgi:hypothetical protein|uniref:Uncharacterized protein n=1 Tax=Fadolivirus FV1/VV64 TaxID=3070911 RepID=A0A7D3UV30_9VIRU|nr:hypothetical protein QKU48_gp0156 [Fadolivirus algeromassiliense]QKF93614.1 hypothetical protein Fadolivirus_1_156 [Fadolivirus FV1/VV64]